MVIRVLIVVVEKNGDHAAVANRFSCNALELLTFPG